MINGCPQGPVFAPMLFNLCVANLAATTSRIYIYVGDIAIATQHTNMGYVL